MSVWTHVSGIIRLDDWTFDESTRNNYDELTKMFKMSVSENNWKKGCNMPCGSEGSLHYVVIPDADKSCVNFCQISFWGDLRDYDSKDVDREFHQWLNKIVKKLEKKNYLVRQLVFLVESEEKPGQVIFKGKWDHGENLEDDSKFLIERVSL